MSFCFGFVCNDAALSTTAQAAFHHTLRRPTGAPHGWGLGYYQAGQPLLRKQPRGPSDELNFCAEMESVRSSVLLGHMRGRAKGGVNTENTQPFRFRNWLFVQSGALDLEPARDELTKAIPDFMRRNMRGTTDSELLFHLFLAFLNDTGKIDNPRIDGATISRQLQAALTYAERLLESNNGGQASHACIATNGHKIVATHRRSPLLITRNSSYVNVGLDQEDKPISYPHLKAVMIAGGEEPSGAGWEAVNDDAVVIVDTDLNIEYDAPHLT